MNNFGNEIQIIEKGGHPAFVVIAHDKWIKMQSLLEEAADIRAYDKAKMALAKGEEVTLPASVAKKMMEGLHPVAVLREWRSLTQRELAQKAGLSPLSISHIETRVRKGGIQSMRKIAKALDVPLETLLDE